MRFSEAVSIHPRYGYKYLDPMPTESELTDFYASDYYDFSVTDRAPDLQRFMGGFAESEIDWLSKTLWLDIYDALIYYNSQFGMSVLDSGHGQTTGNKKVRKLSGTATEVQYRHTKLTIIVD